MLRDDRQHRYVEGIVRGMNQLEAARYAGYAGDDATLKVTGSRLMKNPAVSQAIEDLQAKTEAAADAPEDPELATKHRAFVEALLEGKSAAAAARAAGYGAKSARSQAQRLLARADVRAALEAGRAKREAAAIMSAREQQYLLSELARAKKTAPETKIKAIGMLHRIQSAHLKAKIAAGGAATGVAVANNVVVVVDNGRGPSGGGYG